MEHLVSINQALGHPPSVSTLDANYSEKVNLRGPEPARRKYPKPSRRLGLLDCVIIRLNLDV